MARSRFAQRLGSHAERRAGKYESLKRIKKKGQHYTTEFSTLYSGEQLHSRIKQTKREYEPQRSLCSQQQSSISTVLLSSCISRLILDD